MINFRFHLVSLIAIFLALGLGIVVGSTVVDQAIVDRLDREIDDVREESARRRAENDQLSDAIARADAYMEQTAAFTVEGRLTGVPVVVLAERGVDGDAVEGVIELLRHAGAEAPGVLWLEDDWQLDDPDRLRSLREATGATGSIAAARGQALDALVARVSEPRDAGDPGSGGEPIGPDAPTTVADGTADDEGGSDGEAGEEADDVLANLRAAGFVDFDGDDDALDAFPATPARALLVRGPGSVLLEDDLAAALARSLLDARVPTVVAEAYTDADGEDAPDRGATVAALRADEELATRISTLDDLELVQGRVTAVLALEQVADGVVGHYGHGGGASRRVPEPVPRA